VTVANEPTAEILEAIAGLGDELRSSRLVNHGSGGPRASAGWSEDARVLALEDAYLNLSLQLAEAALQFHDYELARACAARVSARDPLNETACELVMRATAALEDWSGLEDAYRAYADACEEYLGGEPAAQLRRLLASLTAAS
jgi:DNA-binding SARP family transcriptional activator